MSQLIKKPLRFCVRSFWATVLFIVIAGAACVQLGRSVFPILNDYRPQLEKVLGQQLGVNVSIGNIDAQWRGLRPQLALEHVVLSQDPRQPGLSLQRAEAQISLLAIVSDWRLALRKVSFEGLKTTLEQNQEGMWNIQGLPPSTANNSDDLVIDDPLDIFLFGRRIELRDTHLGLVFADGLEVAGKIPSIALENDRGFHRLKANFVIDGREALDFVMEGQGDPRNDREFDAEGYLRLEQFPTEKIIAGFSGKNKLSGNRDDGFGQNEVDISPYVIPDKETDIFDLEQDPFILGEKASELEKADGELDLEIWFSGTSKKGMSIKGLFQLNGSPIELAPEASVPDSTSAEITGTWQLDEGWDLGLNNLKVVWPGHRVPAVNLGIRGNIEKKIRIAFDRIEVGEWLSLARTSGLLGDEAQEALTALQPYGVLYNGELALVSKEEGYLRLRSQVEAAGSKAWHGAPEFSGVEGFVDTSVFDGYFVLDKAQHLEMDLPRVYHQALAFDQASGVVRWHIDPKRKWASLSSNLMEVIFQGTRAVGRIHLDLPFVAGPGKEQAMTLVLGLPEGPATLHQNFLPYTVPEELYQWVGDAIQAGQVQNFGFIYNGSLMGEPEVSPGMQLMADFTEAKIKFQPDWPAIDDVHGHFKMDEDEVIADKLYGDLAKLKVSGGRVELIDNPEHSQSQALQVEGFALGKARDAMSLVKQSPLQDILGEELITWQPVGDISGAASLIIPLEDNVAGAKEVLQLEYSDLALYVPSLDVRLKGLRGDINYSTEKGVFSPKIEGEIWGEPLSAVIWSDTIEGVEQILVDFKAEVKARDLQRWTQLPELGFVSGKTSAEGQLRVPYDSQLASHLVVRSELLGAKVDLPPPFAKKAEDTQTLSFELTMKAPDQQGLSENEYLIHYSDFVEAKIRNNDEAVLGASVGLYEAAEDIELGWVNVGGSLPSADYDSWDLALDQYLATGIEMLGAAFEEEESLPSRVALSLRELTIGESPFANVSIVAESDPNNWDVQIESETLAGDLKIFDDETQPIIMNFRKIHLPEEELATVEPEGEIDPHALPPTDLDEIEFADVDPVDVTIASFFVGAEDYGNWSFKLRPISGGLVAYDLRGLIRGLSVEGRSGGGAELVWLRSGDQDQSYFSGQARAGNLGEVLDAWGVSGALSSESANLDIEAQWKGAPDQFLLANLFGLVSVNIERGRFIRGAEVGENPLLKLIGLLNFDTLARRLRLDFSDLNPEGMGYERVVGTLKFNRGLITVDDALRVETPSTNIQFAGEINVPKQTVDAQVVATLPVAGNLTVAAALTGGLPVAVGVYVVGKLFKKQVDKVSSIRYRVEGSWLEPDVKVEKVFESKTDMNKEPESLEEAPDQDSIEENAKANSNTSPQKQTKDSLEPENISPEPQNVSLEPESQSSGQEQAD